MVDATAEKGPVEAGTESAGVFAMAPIEKVRTNPKQARRYFDSPETKSLNDSVRNDGILQPLVVRWIEAEGIYEIIAGERRYRAAVAAGFKSIPVIVRKVEDRDARRLSLMENIHRESLLPLEETAGFMDLLDSGLAKNQADIARMVNVTRGLVSQVMARAKLPPEIKDDLKAQADGVVTSRHLRELLRCNDKDKQMKLYRLLKEHRWTAEQLALEADRVLGKRVTNENGGDADDNGQVPKDESASEPKEEKTEPTLVIEFADGKIVGKDGHVVFEVRSRETVKNVLGILLQALGVFDAGVTWNGALCEVSMKTVTVNETKYDVDAICDLLVGTEKTEG